MTRFPQVESLASASIDDVLAHWAGLGYYARGRNLHKAAGLIMTEHQGDFPRQIEIVNALPGIGRSTAGAILSLALDQRHTILDGNVKRSLCRYHGIKSYPGEMKTEAKLWKLADLHTPHSRAGDYTQAIMDMGAILCTRSKPNCTVCPHQSDCVAFNQDLVASIPRPRPKKAKPCKHLTMLVLSNDKNQLSLFKRPSSGIWGGLYALPEFESKRACLSLLRSCNIDIKNQTQVENDIKHSFTHFDLIITPLRCNSSAAQQDLIIKHLAKLDKSGVLADKHKLHALSITKHQPTIGIPAPIQKIINQIQISL
jgi:A/G-specific adenine glycosylase